MLVVASRKCKRTLHLEHKVDFARKKAPLSIRKPSLCFQTRKWITTIRQPSAFMALVKGYDGSVRVVADVADAG
jgi:hypothetical protein